MDFKICVISERLSKNFDDGIKNISFNLIKELSKKYKVLGLSEWEELPEYSIKKFKSNRFYISLNLSREIKKFRPNIIFYIPWTSATIRTFFRTKMLKFYKSDAKVVLFAVQPSKYSFFSEKFIPYLAPDLTIVQSKETLKKLKKLGMNVRFIPNGVDLKKFIPVPDTNTKINLRKKWGLPKDKFIILHVGHIEKNRLDKNLLESIQKNKQNQVLVVGSPHTPQDINLLKNLKMIGVEIIPNYIDKIEEIYQLSDCYLFPVISPVACVGIPLSILEAMACNLPIISTKFQGLPLIFKEQKDFLYAETGKEILDAIEKIKKIDVIKTRELVESLSWEDVVNRILFESLNI